MKRHLITASVLASLMLSACGTAVPPATDDLTAPIAESVITSEADPVPSSTAATAVPTDEPLENEVFSDPSDLRKPVPRRILPLPEVSAPDTLTAPYWEETIQWNDGNNENVFHASIPQIYPFSEEAIACSTEIYELLAPRIEENRLAKEQGCSQTYVSVGYDTWVNEDVLSILVWQETSFDYVQYTAYNLDLTSGERLDSLELADKLGMEPEKYQMLIQNAVSDAFRQRYEGAREDDFYQMQHKESISRRNLDQSMLYLGKNGLPMLVFDLYALAGANSYPTILPLNFSEN